jgi:hypothetical protein
MPPPATLEDAARRLSCGVAEEIMIDDLIADLRELTDEQAQEPQRHSA